MNEPIAAVLNNIYESASLGSLFTALSKAQMEMEIANTENINPFFKSKYADLATVVKASRPFLSKNGLCVIQRIISDLDGKMHLLTRLAHASGEWIESKMPIVPSKPDIQSIGSYITYLRRYNYSSIVGVVAGDEDDDGEKAMDRSNTKKQPINDLELDKLLFSVLELYKDDDISQASMLDYIKSLRMGFYGPVDKDMATISKFKDKFLSGYRIWLGSGK